MHMKHTLGRISSSVILLLLFKEHVVKIALFSYVASTTTPTPAGFIVSVMANAICFVSRSCTGKKIHN